MPGDTELGTHTGAWSCIPGGTAFSSCYSCWSPSLHLLGGCTSPNCAQKRGESGRILCRNCPAQVLREVAGGDSSAPAPEPAPPALTALRDGYKTQLCIQTSPSNSPSWLFPHQTFLVLKGKCGTACPEQLCVRRANTSRALPILGLTKIPIWGSSTGSKHGAQCKHHTVAARAPKLPPRLSPAAKLSVPPQTAPSERPPSSSRSLIHSQPDHSMIPSQLFFSRPGTIPGVKHPPPSCTPSQPTALEVEINTYHHNEGFVPPEF